MQWVAFCCQNIRSLRENGHCNLIQSYSDLSPYPVLKHSCPYASGLSQDDSAPSTGHEGTLKCLLDKKSWAMAFILIRSHSKQTPMEDFDTLCQTLLPTIFKMPTGEMSFRRMLFISPVQLQTLLLKRLWHVLVLQHLTKILYCSFNQSPGCIYACVRKVRLVDFPSVSLCTCALSVQACDLLLT